MLHRPRNILRSALYSGFFFATGLAPALALDPTGDWRVADGVANIRVAQCNGSMWGAVSWEKDPGGHDAHNPDVSKQSRPTLGMPILIDMKKKPGVDTWEGQVYNAKDGQFYSSTIRPLDPDHMEIQGCVLGFLCGGETWTRVAPPIPSSSRQQHGQGLAEGCDRACRPSRTENHRADNHRFDQSGGKESQAGVRRSGRRHLPTPRYRAVCPLAPAGTAAPRRASSPATAPAACPCWRCPDATTATGCRRRWPWSAR